MCIRDSFIADLIGLSVTSDEGEELGVIDDVLQTGANAVSYTHQMCIRDSGRAAGSGNQTKEAGRCIALRFIRRISLL